MGAALGPPWILFTDKGKPVAILPAGRPGEVAKVDHLTLEQAKELVAAANAIHNEETLLRLKYMHWKVRSDLDELNSLLQKRSNLQRRKRWIK